MYRGDDFLKEERDLLHRLDAMNDSMSYNLINETHGFHGRKHTEESRIKMKNSHPHRTGEKNPMYGRVGQLSPTFGFKGEKSFVSKLTQAQADEIRIRLKSEKIKLKDLGKEYSVSRFTIARIRDHIIYND